MYRTMITYMYAAVVWWPSVNYTVFQKNPCDYVFDDNLNSKRPSKYSLR